MKGSKFISNSLLAVATVTLWSLMACAPKNKVEILDYRVIEELEGTWMKCEENDAIEGKDISTSLIVDDFMGVRTIIVHDSTSLMCAGPPMLTIIHAAAFTSGRDESPVSGTIAMDFFVQSVLVQADDASYLATAQALSENGAAVTGQTYDVTDFAAWTTKQLFEPDDLFYTRIQIDTSASPNELFEGDWTADPAKDGTSEGNRVETMFADPFIKL